jgi:hypothetical protein
LGFGQRYHVDRHGQLALKQLRLSVLTEMHTNSYTGSRLLGRIKKAGVKKVNVAYVVVLWGLTLLTDLLFQKRTFPVYGLLG